MAKRSINSNIESHLINNEPFEYAHLIKFERPFHAKDGEFRTGTGRYVFLTDGARDIEFDADGDGSAETYRANGVLSVGSYSETTVARATGMSLTIAGETLGTSITVTGNLNSSGTFTTTGDFVNGEILDFVEQGFREGDKIKVEKANGTNFADGTSAKIYIISGFTGDNQDITFARTGTDTDDSTFITLNSTSFIFTLLNEEIRGALLDKGTEGFTSNLVTNSTSITLESSNSKIQIGQLVTGKGVEEDTIVTSINGTSLVVSQTQKTIGAGEKLTFTNPSFVNREVFIYKVFLDTDGSIVGSSSVLVFKGIINSTDIQETPTSSRVKWNLSSHWGDFDAVVGRLTTDELHRALDTNGKPSIVLAERPEYATDLGFLHAESSLNTIAVYQTTETRYELQTKRRGGLAGLFGGKKYSIKEVQEQVDNEVDLSIYLQGKYLPVVYGVQRVNGVPVFADTLNTNSKEVYVVYAISEGENHGIYNLYIDGAPLICIDKSDYDVRNTSAVGSDSNQLQCYGRADQGGTLGGAIVTGSTNYTSFDDEPDYRDYETERTYSGTTKTIIINNRRFDSFNESNITETSVTDSAEGLQHKETASISHPFNMHFTFYSGRSYQAGDNNLSNIASSNGFKRQVDYYGGDEAYWSPDHKLLDTAYAVMKFTIDADQTTIPDIEYVVKGKVLECHNYDGTYVPDVVLGTSDNHTNFKEGDIVEVQYSSNDFSTSSSAGTNFRILDKYQFTTARGQQHYRFRLDSVPNIEDNTQVRLKSGANYWHMVTHDHAVVGTSTTLPSQTLTITNLQTNGSGLLTATLPSATATTLQALYPNISSGSNSDAMIQFTGDTDGIFTSLKNAVLQASLSGTTLTFLNTSFSANQSSTGTLSGINIQAAEVFDFSTISDISGITDTDEIVGCDLQIVETGESRRIIGFNTTTNYATIEAPFITPPTSDNTFKITGRGKDLRSSINPAIQTLDLLTNSRYGKGLSLANDIDLASVKAAALLCDARSDVIMPLSSTASCGAGDIYKLTDDGTSSGNHVASGKVLNATSSSSKVTFTDVSGKFIRNYENYISYSLGDVVTNIVNGQSEYYRVTSGAGYKSTAPSHTTGTVNGFEHLTTLTLHKVSGSGPSTLSVAKDGRLLTYSLYDSDFVKYWRYIGWEENRQWCVTRHQTNFIFDTSRSIFENINALLSHYNGILSYSNGKYVLDVETQVTSPTASISNGIQSNPLYISNDDIIGNISLVDNSQRNSKNTIKASIADPQNNFSSRSVSFFNSDFLKADRNKVKTGSYPITGITSYYNARIGVEKELIQSRYTKEISFTVGPRGLLLKAGEVIALTYEPFGFESKLFRIENLTYGADCNTQIKAREYDDSIYTITPQVSSSAQRAATGGNLELVNPGLPTSLTATTTKPGIITLNWTNTTGNSVVSKDYKELIDSTEIWRASTQGTSGNVPQHASLIAVVDNASTYNDALAQAGNFYYWIRHRRVSSQTSSNASVLLTGDFNAGITAGVEGTAKVLSPQLDVDISSIQIKFDDANSLSPTGAAQDVVLTATLRNITPDSNGVVFTLVDADQSSQSDVQFVENSSTTYSDTSSPYQATVDASTFEHDSTNKFVKVQVTDTSGESFTELVSATVTKDGSSGSIGADAIAVKLEASQYVISYSAQGTETDSISLSTTLQGSGEFTGTPYYEFLIDGTSKQNTTTTTYTVVDADEPAVNENKTITVKVRDGGTTGTVKATDSISVYGIESGSDSTTAFLTNSAHVVPTNESGTVDSSLITSGNINDAGGTFKVFIGTTDRTTSCTYTVQSESGVDATIGASTGVYTISSTGLSDYGVAVFRATIPANISPTGTQFTIDQTYTIAKSKKGNQGADGDDAKTVRLTAADYSIVYDADGANPSPSGTITLTATAQNFSGTNQANARFRFTGDGITDETSYTAGTNGTDTFSFTVPTSHFTSPKALRVGVSESAAPTTEVAFDTINIFAVKEGSNAYTVILDNESHAIPADQNGANLDFTGSGATISIFKGSTELNGITTGTPTSGQFKVTATGSGITPSSTNGTSTGDPVIFADHSGMTGTSASISYSINIENIQTVIKKQTFTRVDDGSTGATGDRGRKVQELDLYYAETFSGSTESAPSTPTTGTYDFDTGTISSIPLGWSATQPEFAFGVIVWNSTALALETASLNDTSGTLSWSTPASYLTPVSNVNFIFQRSATQPSTPSATNFPSIPASWYDDVGSVPSGANPIWVSKGESVYSTAGGVFKYETTWQAPNIIEGSNGTDGQSVKTVDLFKKNDSTFSTTQAGSFSDPTNGVESGWTTTQPTITATSDKIYKVSRTFTSDGQSPQDANWSSPVIVAQREDGNNDPRSAYIFIYNSLGGTVPSNTTTGTPYNFETGVLTIPSTPTGWTQTRPSLPYFISRVLVAESAYDGAQNVTYNASTRRGTIGERDKGDLDLDITDQRIRFRFDSGDSYSDSGLLPSSVKNTEISLTASGGTVTLNNASNTNNTFTKASVGLSAVTNDAQVKSDLSNLTVESANLEVVSGELRPKATLKNSDLRITNDSNNLRIRDSGNNILDSVTGLGQGLVNLSGVENNATEGATAGSNLKDSGGTTLGDADVRNDDLQIDYSGTTVRIKKGASTVIDSQAAPAELKNDQISLTASGGTVTLNNASATNNTFNKSSVGLSAVTNDAQVKADLTNLSVESANLEVISGELRPKATLKNSDLRISNDLNNLRIRDSANNILASVTGLGQGLVNLSGVQNNADQTSTNTAAAITNQGDLATRSDVLAGTHIKDSGGTVLGNDDIKNSSLDVDISGTAIKLKIGTTETSSVTADQGLVGLSGVQNNADQTSTNTAAAITNQGDLATRSDVRAGTHIKDSGGVVLGDTAIKNSSVTLAKSAGNGTTGATFSLTNGNTATVALTAADAQIASDSSGINIAGTRKATHNGTAINTSGNVVSSMTVASGGSIVIGNITIDGTNGRILITD